MKFYISCQAHPLLQRTYELLSRKLQENGGFFIAENGEQPDCILSLRLKKLNTGSSFVSVYFSENVEKPAICAQVAAANAIGAVCKNRIPSDTYRGIERIVLELNLTKDCAAALADKPEAFSKAILASLSEDESENNEFDKYLTENPSKGYIEVQVYSGMSSITIPNARVTISKTLSKKYILSEVYTNQIGRTPRVALPAKPSAMSQQPESELPYTFYDILVEKENYLSTLNLNVPIFENILSVQPVRMNTDTGGNEEIFDEMGSYNL